MTRFPTVQLYPAKHTFPDESTLRVTDTTSAVARSTEPSSVSVLSRGHCCGLFRRRSLRACIATTTPR